MAGKLPTLFIQWVEPSQLDGTYKNARRHAAADVMSVLVISVGRVWYWASGMADGTALALPGPGNLLIIHIWTMLSESTLRSGREGFFNEDVNRLLKETQAAHRQWLIEFLHRHPLDDVKYEADPLKGEAVAMLHELAQAKALTSL